MARLGRGALAIAVLLAAASCSREVEAPGYDELVSRPFTLVAGAFPGNTWIEPFWSLKHDPGRGDRLSFKLESSPRPEIVELHLELRPEQLEQLARVLVEERFFDLPLAIGSDPGHRCSSIRFVQGEYEKQVHLKPGHDPADPGYDPDSEEVARFARVFRLIRSWAEKRAGQPLLPDHLP